ncbi:MAG: hypothetical protein KF855_00660 [Acidobacteria bacterium]|nr:hypothetical protein [Acidobacteriota bacterium]
MSLIVIKQIGSGSSWRVIGEISDNSVVKQLTPYSCVAAVGEMLLRDRGIIVSQEAIIDIIGQPSDIVRLAAFLNKVDANEDGKSWNGLIVQRKALSVLIGSGQFGAVIRDGSPLGHLVLVKEADDNKLVIYDPWDATSYKVSLFEFFRHWNGEVIFRWNF